MVTVQQTTVTRELSEVQALNTYIHSRLNLDNAMGRILDVYDVNVGDAKKGTVGREPDCDSGRSALGRHPCRSKRSRYRLALGQPTRRRGGAGERKPFDKSTIMSPALYSALCVSASPRQNCPSAHVR